MCCVYVFVCEKRDKEKIFYWWGGGWGTLPSMWNFPDQGLKNCIPFSGSSVLATGLPVKFEKIYFLSIIV